MKCPPLTHVPIRVQLRHCLQEAFLDDPASSCTPQTQVPTPIILYENESFACLAPWPGRQLWEDRVLVHVFFSSFWYWAQHRMGVLSVSWDGEISEYFFYPPGATSSVEEDTCHGWDLSCYPEWSSGVDKQQGLARVSYTFRACHVPSTAADEMYAISRLNTRQSPAPRCAQLLWNGKRRAGETQRASGVSGKPG